MCLRPDLVSTEVELGTSSGDRGSGPGLGLAVDVVLDQGVLTRFDIVLKGDFVGQGRYTPGAPTGAFPLAVALRLASDKDVASQVRPQALKAVGPGYLRMGGH